MAARRPLHRNPVLLTLATLCAALAALVLYAVLDKPSDREPPPLGPHAADIHRLTWPVHSSPGAKPWVGQIAVHLAHGRTVFVGLWDRFGYDPERGVGVGFQGPSSNLTVRYLTPRHPSAVAGGVRVTLLKLWNEPGAAHDAADLRIDPATAP
jgi:hypothetical protein